MEDSENMTQLLSALAEAQFNLNQLLLMVEQPSSSGSLLSAKNNNKSYSSSSKVTEANNYRQSSGVT